MEHVALQQSRSTAHKASRLSSMPFIDSIAEASRGQERELGSGGAFLSGYSGE